METPESPFCGMPRKALFKTIAFSLLPCLLLLLLVELSVRIVFYQKHAPYSSGVLQVFKTLSHRLDSYKAQTKRAEAREVMADGRLFEEDSVLGYKTIPGAHTVTYRIGGRKLVTRVIVGADGYRTTASNPSDYRGRPELWVFGCSFTWGESINNDQTFPWLIQKSLTGWRIRNLARPAYSNLHALLQLEEAVKNKERLPEIAVFVFNDFHAERNVGAPSWLSQLRTARAGVTGPSGLQHIYRGYRYPRAVINPEGNFTIEYVPLIEESERGQADPDRSYTALVSEIIFHRLFKLCVSHGILPVFALQGGSPDNPIVKYVSETGFEVVDMSVDLNADHGQKYRNVPFDPHPNALAQSRYYERIMPTILQLTQRMHSRLDSSRAAGVH